MKRKISVFVVPLVAFGQMTVAHANTTWHLSKTASSANLPVLSDMGYWGGTDGVAPGTTDDLVAARNGETLRFRGVEFTGNSLRIGENGDYMMVTHDSTTMTFPAGCGGLILDKGLWWFNRNGIMTLTGPTTVLSSPAYPFTFRYGNAAHIGKTATIGGPVSGAAGTAIVLGHCPWTTGICAQNTTFQLGDFNGYAGKIVVTSEYANVGSDFGSCVTLGAMDSPCVLDVWRGGVLTTVASDTAARVGAIAFHKGARLLLNADLSNRQIGCISATGLVSIEEGPLDVRLTAGFKGTDAVRVPILAGAPESSFTAADFKLDNASSVADSASALLHFEVVVDEGTGLRTLYLATYDVEQMTYYTDEGHPNESRSQGSSLTNALAWSDGRLPHTNAAYRTTKYLRTLNAPDATYAFPGESLWLMGGHLRLTVAEFSVPQLYSSMSSSISTTADKEGVATVAAERFCLADGVLVLMAYKNQTLRLQGEISGSALIDMRGINTSTRAISATYELSGVNTGFSGAISVWQELNKDYISYEDKHPTLVVNDGRNLGGIMAAFNPRALKLADLSFLSVTNPAATVTLAGDLNRGVYIAGRACFNVTGGATLDVDQPILLGGKLWKDGEGTLILGGAMRHEVSDGGDLTDTPRAGSNLVELVAGTVKIRNADAFAGAQVMVDNGAELVVDLAGSDDEGLKRYGIRNVTAETPFALGEGLSALPIALALPSAEAVPAAATNALFTIKATALPTLRGILPSAKALNPWPMLPARYVYQSDAENGYVTVALESRAYGTVFIFR